MSHELATLADGRAAFFEVGRVRTAWHRLGTLLPDAPSLDDAIATAGLGYTVEKVPVEIRLPSGMLIPSTKGFAMLRADTHQELGVVGPGYEPVQNVDAFRVLEPLLDTGLAKLETGGVLRDGADAFLLIRWDVERFPAIVREVYADEVLPFGLVATNHSGRRGVLLKETPVRVVCANTLGAAETTVGNQAIVRHTANAADALVSAAELLWRGVLARHAEAAAQYRVLRATRLTDAEFTRLVLDPIVPRPQDAPTFNPEARLAERVVARADHRRAVLTRLWTAGKGHVGDRSAWEAYNGVVEAVDHDEDGLFPTRGGVWGRGASLLGGRLGQLKDGTLHRLMAFAEAE